MRGNVEGGARQPDETRLGSWVRTVDTRLVDPALWEGKGAVRAMSCTRPAHLCGVLLQSHAPRERPMAESRCHYFTAFVADRKSDAYRIGLQASSSIDIGLRRVAHVCIEALERASAVRKLLPGVGESTPAKTNDGFRFSLSLCSRQDFPSRAYLSGGMNANA